MSLTWRGWCARYDTCCFSPHNRHEEMLAYEADIRAELLLQGGGSGWFTSAAVNHSKHGES